MEEGTDLYDGVIMSIIDLKMNFEDLNEEMLSKVHERLQYYAELVKSEHDPATDPYKYLEAQGLGKKLGIDSVDGTLEYLLEECEVCLGRG